MIQTQTGRSIIEEMEAENRAVDILCKMTHSKDMLWPEFRVVGRTKTGEILEASHSGDVKKR